MLETALSAFWLIVGLVTGALIMKDWREAKLGEEEAKRKIIIEECNRLLIENGKLEALYDLSTGNRVRRAG